MPSVYVLTGDRKGKSAVLNDRYVFVEGVMLINDDQTADAIAPIMEFYAARRLSMDEYEKLLLSKQAKSAKPAEA